MSEDKEFSITDNTCHNCYKTLSGKSQLYRHLREVHNEYERLNSFYEKNECMYKCLEGCEVSFRFNRDLRHHLNHCHNFNIVENSKRFLQIKAFHEWLIQEQEGGAQFVKHRGPNRGPTNKNKKITYYSCNRSGLSKAKTNGRKRQLKKAGTRKMNAGCTSYIKLEEHGDSCTATYCDFHYGHKRELEHLPLRLESRAAILHKLANGAKLLKIDLNKDDIEFNSILRSDLLTGSDIKSLKQFSRSRNLRVPIPKLIENRNDLGDINASTISSYKETDGLCSDIDDEINEYPDTNETTAVIHKQDILEEDVEETKLVEVQEEEEDRPVSDNKTIEIHYVKDTEAPSETEEDIFGYYVAAMLKQIDPSSREAAKNEINEILQKFYTVG